MVEILVIDLTKLEFYYCHTTYFQKRTKLQTEDITWILFYDYRILCWVFGLPRIWNYFYQTKLFYWIKNCAEKSVQYWKMHIFLCLDFFHTKTIQRIVADCKCTTKWFHTLQIHSKRFNQISRLLIIEIISSDFYRTYSMLIKSKEKWNANTNQIINQANIKRNY